ncbi:MAG TPA: hypothetical protein VH108_06485 [Gaiellaceae bacterium]|jgi:hypothetical protein|nr:hypothetical protein [Gaiellaceae bacterium]
MKISKRHRRRRSLITIFVLLTEALPLWLRGYRLGGNVVVRCRSGHLFTTIWVPGVSVKSLRLGWWRLQRCPVGRHWSIVTPVRQADLSERERANARKRKDVRLP